MRKPYLHKGSGQTVMLPEGVGFGWDHMPGDLWVRGLVPQPLDVLAIDLPPPVLEVEIDQRVSIDDLRAKALPFKNAVMAEGLEPEVYAAAFLEAFGLKPGEATLWEDVEGSRILIAGDMFRQRSGECKAQSRGHGDHALLLAETLQDPDEIWVALRELPDPTRPGEKVHAIVRRYIRVDPERSVFGLFELGRQIWFPVTGYGPLNRSNPDFDYIDRQRIGKLIWKRK